MAGAGYRNYCWIEKRLLVWRLLLEHSFYSEAVILTNGTFLNGLMHVGFSRVRGGRSGDQASSGLSEQLEELGFTVERMKTGTSARVDGRSIDFSKMNEQKGDEEGRKFSYGPEEIKIERTAKLFYNSYK